MKLGGACSVITTADPPGEIIDDIMRNAYSLRMNFGRKWKKMVSFGVKGESHEIGMTLMYVRNDSTVISQKMEMNL